MRNYILVAGVDYHPLSEGKLGTDFVYYCNKRHEKLFLQAKIYKEDLFFYILDIKRGKVNLISYRYNTNSKIFVKEISIYKRFDSVTKSNYFDFNNNGHKYFHPNGKSIISKFTIYNLIETIGENSPNTLYEVNVFSHAYFDGPILVNSKINSANYYDYVSPSVLIDVVTLGYDPNDYDMRRWDFNDFYNRPENKSKKKMITKAFDLGGIIKIWGCSFPIELHDFLHKIRTNKSYKNSDLTNDIIFEFPANYFSQYQLSIINSVTKPNIYNRLDKISISFLSIKKIFCPQIIYTYASITSKFMDKEVQAALPATYSEIFPIFRISPKVLSNVTFFKSYFGFKTDKLNYGIYKPDFDCNNYY